MEQEQGLTKIGCRVCRGNGRFEHTNKGGSVTGYSHCGQCNGHGTIWVHIVPKLHLLEQPSKPLIAANPHRGSYCLVGPGEESETERAAQRHADTLNKPQTVHHHSFDAECLGEVTNCMVFMPDERRHKALA